ncbi:MAG: RNA pyrophosphohydrolase [Alphaproteobacteria bacterium]|nr:MAG: RNA pyrophosphohydrolase [Alphaproteobacteria bacterium]TAF76714.1 MAG: RNA pyrophosphohydrolase [Alphaproteobacteria bacterium]
MRCAMGVELGTRLKHRYRRCVGAMIMDEEGRILVGRRVNTLPDDAHSWQMPQGGIDGNETPQDALLRELREEVGTDDVTVIAYIDPWLYYDLPDALIPHFWGGRFFGQQQKWFLVQLNNGAHSINIHTAEPEFHAIEWIEVGQVLEHVVPFKYEVYQAVLGAFLPYVQQVKEKGHGHESLPIIIERLASVA